jgi:hypothetical protein
MIDKGFIERQIERCRRLAKGADPSTEKRLLKLAKDYEEELRQLNASTPKPEQR